VCKSLAVEKLEISEIKTTLGDRKCPGNQGLPFRPAKAVMASECNSGGSERAAAQLAQQRVGYAAPLTPNLSPPIIVP